MSNEVTRHFATLQGRQVHYRRAGEGAPVLLLHQTPTSSAELVPLMRQLASRFTVIAPDMPGYGASDRLGSAPTILTIDALADDLAILMSILCIDAAGIYGFHTGASIATALARRHPARVVVAIVDGLLCLDPDESEEWSARYLEPFVPRWDGGHLAWLWTRLKDQSVFFPWYERSARGRLAIDASNSEALAAKAQDWLHSGELYHAAYRAAMGYDPRADITRISTPHYVIAQQGDPLASHIKRLPPLPVNVRVEVLASSIAVVARIAEIFGTHCSGLSAPPLSVTSPIEAGIWREYVGSSGAQLCVLRAGDTDGRPVIVQHDAQSCAIACAPLVAGFSSTRAVYAVDLPGHGLSDVVPGEPDPAIEQIAAHVGAALAVYGLDDCDYVGIGAGAALVVELERAMNTGSLTLIAPIDLSGHSELRQSLVASYIHAPIDSYGGYLLKAWHEVRDHQLFFPWFERRRAYGVASSPMLVPEWLQAQTVAHVMSGASGVALRRREAHYPLLDRLSGRNASPLFAVSGSSARRMHTQTLVVAGVPLVLLEDSMADWARSLAGAVASNRSNDVVNGGQRSGAS